MAVYVDELKGPKGSERCHLVADRVAELLLFAQDLGIANWYYHPAKPGKIAHYDLTPAWRLKAVQAGAKEVTARVLVAMMREPLGGPQQGP